MAVDPARLRAEIRPETAGVIVVHIGGLVTPDIVELRNIRAKMQMQEFYETQVRPFLDVSSARSSKR